MKPFRGKVSGKTMTWTYSEYVEACEKRIAQLEAELANWRGKTPSGVSPSPPLCNDPEHMKGRIFLALRQWKFRAVKAETEHNDFIVLKTLYPELKARAEKAEAEVERLSLLSQKPREKRLVLTDYGRAIVHGVNPSGEPLGGVSPSPPVDSATLLAKARAAERKKPRVEPPFRRSAARKERDP